MINAINFIKSHEEKSDGKIFAISKNYVGVPLSKNHFKKIVEKKEGELFAIDGGCAIIADGGGWIIAKIRVGVVGFDGNKKIYEKKSDYTATIVHQKNDFNILLENSNGKIENLLPKFKNIDIEELPAKIMKILEWLECEQLCNKNTNIVMDGALEPDNEKEKEIIENIEKSKSTIIGFCKTSRIRTNTGRSLLGVINTLGDKKWYYYPIFENEMLIRTIITKLNKHAKFCNKVQLFKKTHDFNKILNILAYFASDSEMLGYPYPLVKVDKIARITSFEKKRETAVLERVLKQTALINDTYSQTMHPELDKRMYRKTHQKD